MPNLSVIIVAGGSGTRMGTTVPKQFLLLDRKPVLQHTIERFLEAYPDIDMVVVLAEQDLPALPSILPAELFERIRVTRGGATRFDSVKNGLALVDEDRLVFVHDAARCLVSTSLIHRCYTAALSTGNAIPAIAATDTIRIVSAEGSATLNRESLRIIQTPQTFFASTLKKALSQPYQPGFTDEASAVELLGESITLVEGETENIKITRPADMLLAETILQQRKSTGK